MFTDLRIVSHVNLKAEDGATALMMAAQAGRLNCVQLLLDFGADVNIEVRYFAETFLNHTLHQADDGTLAAHLACIARSNAAPVLELVMTTNQKPPL